MHPLMELVKTWGVYWGIALVLSAYQYSARRRPKTSRLPIGLFLLYAWGKPLVRWLPVDPVWPSAAEAILLWWGGLRLAFFLFVEHPAHRTGRPLARLTRDFLVAILFSVSAFLILRLNTPIHFGGLLATSAVLTAVIGLSLQATLTNFFAGLALQVERPFTLGDWIQIGGQEGEVISITWRATRLLTRDRVMIYLPNATITSGTFRVVTRPERAYTVIFTIGVEYGASPDRVRRTIFSVLRDNPLIPSSPESEVRLISFGDFAITYEIRFPFEDPRSQNRVIADLNAALWYALKREGIRIPFPIRDVQHAHIERKRDALEREHEGRTLADRLQGLSLLSALPDGAREQLVRDSQTRLFGPGETLLREGDPGESMFVLLEGQCGVFRGPPPHAQPLAHLSAGDCFGEMSLLTGAPRNATVRAESAVRVLEIAKPLFSDILNANPEVARQLAEMMAKRSAAAGRPAGEAPLDAPGLLSRIRRFFRIAGG